MIRPSADERELWRRVVHDVAPLPGRQPHRGGGHSSREVPPNPPLPAGATKQKAGGTEVVLVPATAQRSPKPLPPLSGFAGVDRRTAERVRRGRYPVEDRLDLHGLTQEEAHRALRRFVLSAREAGRRCVLVITGNGRLTGGVLKAAVPRWLAEPELRRHLIAVAPAQQRDGGAGALYLLLRRQDR